MGRQVTFFMAKEDEDQFLDFARQTGNIAIVPAISPDNNFQLVERLPEPFSVDLWRQFYLWNRSITPSYQTEYEPERGYYVINGLLSSLVEFSRSYIKDNTMFGPALGRIHDSRR